MKKVVIVGGGTAGWLTALVVNKFWKNTNVTLIESSKIGILGAGEGSTPNFGDILNVLNINQNDFFLRTGSTIKNGIRFKNWTGDDSIIYHGFAGDSSNPFVKRTAFHFDAKLVANYFKEIAINRGVNWIDGEIVNIPNNGEIIQNLKLNDGSIIDLDFVFDCSGFARLIIDKVHNEKWISYSEYLMMNKAFGFFLPQTNEYTINDKEYTNITSMNCGWMWQVALQHRWGCGYVFNDRYINVDEAKLEVETLLGLPITIQKVFDFNPGKYERSWIGNSISIGLSYGFLEPLEATSLMSIIMQLKKLIDIEFDEKFKDEYNEACSEVLEQNMLFTRYHYLCERDDTQFWKDCTSMPIPSKLKKIIDSKNNLIPNSNEDLIDMLELKRTKLFEITFFPYSYQTIRAKNKKIIKKEII
jgi:tryptophan halogenase